MNKEYIIIDSANYWHSTIFGTKSQAIKEYKSIRKTLDADIDLYLYEAKEIIIN